MISYGYDGSFEGFLCAVVDCLEQGAREAEFAGEGTGQAPGLFTGNVRQVPTVRETALLFRKRFVETVSHEAFARARYAFHSQKTGIERMVWHYLRLGLEQGPRLAGLLAVEPVWTVDRIARKVAHEAHKYKGFVRFHEVEAGFLYARIEPEADILALIAPHFVARVGDRPWMIHDLGRRRAALYDLGSWRLVDGIELNAEPQFTAEEQGYAALWRQYFRRHAITERHNPILQRTHVPLRYRRHLTEFAGEPK